MPAGLVVVFAVCVAFLLPGEAVSDSALVPGKNGRIVLQGAERGGRDLGWSNLYAFRLDANGYFVQLTKGDWHDANPSWSPDGRWLAFDSNRKAKAVLDWTGATPVDRDLFVMRDDASGLRRLTSGAAVDEDPAWAPDGTILAFTSDRSGNGDVWTIGRDGTGLTDLTASSRRLDMEPSWSPDGSRIAFNSYRDGNQEIYVMDADGSNVIRLTTSPGMDRHPAWAPDGARIAFDSERSGNFEIYTMKVDGSDVRRLTNSALTDSRPAWSPDARWIVFQSERQGKGGRELNLMHPDGGRAEQISEGGSSWATSPDWQPVSSIDPCVYKGTVYADELQLSDYRDIACALAGNDLVKADAGNDEVDGGPGNDILVGGPGNDRLAGGSGNDMLDGGAGRDVLNCGPGRDKAFADRSDVVAKDCEVVIRS